MSESFHTIRRIYPAPILPPWMLSILLLSLPLGGLFFSLSQPVNAAQPLDDMHVVGIVTGTGGVADYALISHRNNEPEIYHTGDQIVPGITLEKILTDRIRAKSGNRSVEIKLGSPFAGDATDSPSAGNQAMDYATAPDQRQMDAEPSPTPEPSQEMSPQDSPVQANQEPIPEPSPSSDVNPQVGAPHD